MLGSKNIYSDTLISATDLNRQPGRVLDLALKHPVTITRNDEAFALLRREDAARMIETSTHVELLVEIIQVIYRQLLGRSPELAPPYQWLTQFDPDELNELLTEINDTIQSIFAGEQTWESVDLLIYEWQESAQAIISPDLAAAFETESAETPLTHPQPQDPVSV
jgi:hypothetical protein